VKKIFLFFHTIKFLKFIQIYYRLFYFIRKSFRKVTGFEYPSMIVSYPSKLRLQPSIPAYTSYFDNGEFNFLNIKHDFKKNIDWNYNVYGKLWTYNLNYFDFLNQKHLKGGIQIIEDFIRKQEKVVIGYEPFPIALRGINWIKYLTYNHILNQKIADNLYAQYFRLIDNLEYHLLGNHLLENAFSLLYGAYYFKNEVFYSKAKKILLEELEEQILQDGVHFELSPMYHQIMLFRLLDVINLLQNNEWKDDDLLRFLHKKAELMLGWLKSITYKNGDIPLLNDSTNNIAPNSKELFAYAESLSLKIAEIDLNTSGYRKVIKNRYEAIIDVGSIGASYIPGHAHSDTFSFEVYKLNKPFIVDTGLSTYETNARRTSERSTQSHNTVEVNGINQTEVWGGFRVGKRANILFLEEDEDYIKSSHDGYIKQNIIHTRTWEFQESEILIIDELSKPANAIAFLHFHPSISQEEIRKVLIVDKEKYQFSEYKYASEFNNLEKAWCVKMKFISLLKITINIK